LQGAAFETVERKGKDCAQEPGYGERGDIARRDHDQQGVHDSQPGGRAQAFAHADAWNRRLAGRWC
jgi:hypothetical protein